MLALRAVRRALLLGLAIRIPMWAGGVILTLHVVTHLHRSYGAAGLLTGLATVAMTISNPWRGRRLDRAGLRSTLVPSLVVLTACWSVAPFVGYWPLLAFATVAGLFIVPSFSIVRQALLAAVPESHRLSALSIDSVVVEISFMIGPALGVLLATTVPTSWALFACELAAVGGGIVLWLADPPLRPAADGSLDARAPGERPAHPAIRSWLTPDVLAILVMCAAATLVLTGSDVGIVAALRSMHHQSWIGWELAVWGLGSAVGGLVYGALRRPVPVPVLLGLLAATTIPVVLAREPVLLAVLLFTCGLFCAPAITATVDALSRAVPEAVRGEALGWHGSALTAGSAAGAPLAGVAIDRISWHGGFVIPGLIGVLAAAGGALAARSRRRGSPAPAPLYPPTCRREADMSV